MTAQVFSEQVEACLKAGMNGHVAKPYTLESLVEAVVSSQMPTKVG